MIANIYTKQENMSNFIFNTIVVSIEKKYGGLAPRNGNTLTAKPISIKFSTTSEIRRWSGPLDDTRCQATYYEIPYIGQLTDMIK